METERKKKGFTLVELLTVMSIIAILIGLLVPALNLVRKMAKDTRQRAQFHSIEVALEIFNGENDGYPPSDVRGTSKYTVGAQHLAEALVGRDLLGYDPLSSWDTEDDKDATIPVYGNGNAAADKASLERRRGPYLSSENVEAYEIGQLYADTGTVYDNNAPVLTDAYRIKTIPLTGKNVQAGSPVLYYKADISSKLFPDLTQATISDTQAPTYIFNSIDNEDLIALGTVKDKNVLHHFDTTYEDTASSKKGRRIFYDTITNPKITSQPRPYNMTSYILISAGYDGIYGTSDDITNFSE